MTISVYQVDKRGRRSPKLSMAVVAFADKFEPLYGSAYPPCQCPLAPKCRSRETRPKAADLRP